MSEKRLTDEEFRLLFECTTRAAPVSRDLRIRGVEEHRSLRAAALTGDEREALRPILEAIVESDHDDSIGRIKVYSKSGVNYLPYAAKDALDRIIAAAEVKK